MNMRGDEGTPKTKGGAGKSSLLTHLHKELPNAGFAQRDSAWIFFSFRLAKEGWQKVSESLGGKRLAL